MQNTSVEPEFEKWAKGFSGMDGGNLEADLWFCGIEFGGGHDCEISFNERYSYKDESGQKIPCWNDNFRNENNDYYTTWQYNQKVAKVVCQFLYDSPEDYKKYMDKLFTENGETFKMNLYPMNFLNNDDMLWEEKHYNKTGFPNKQIYRAWCMLNRFEHLKGLVEKYEPKILVCTGNSLKRDFLLAFAPKDSLFDINLCKREQVDKYRCEWFKINDGKTSVIITPFFGQGGIMSNNGLIELARLMLKLAHSR